MWSPPEAGSSKGKQLHLGSYSSEVHAARCVASAHVFCWEASLVSAKCASFVCALLRCLLAGNPLFNQMFSMQLSCSGLLH
jgi:hypothetical protein